MAQYTMTAGGGIRGTLGGGFKMVARGKKTIVVEPPVTGDATFLFSTTFENADTVPTWSEQEIAFGESFAKGDVPAGTRVRAVIDGIPIPCQISNRRVWADGSLKVADIRALLPPIPVGGVKLVTWERVAGNWAAHDAALHTSPAAVTSKVSLEYAFPSWKGRNASSVLTTERGPKSFRSANMLAPGNSAWIDTITEGPVCTEWRASDFATTGSVVNEFTSDFAAPDFETGGAVKDENFGALLYVRAWGGTAGNPKRIQFIYRTVQGWSTDTPADEQGLRVDINLLVNGTVVRGAASGTAGWAAVNTWKGGFLVSAGADGSMDWYDVATSSFVTPPKVIYRRNLTYGRRAQFILPIDTSNSAFPMTAGATSYAPARRGPLRPVQDDVADHAMLGWTTSKPMVWSIAAHARATAAQLIGHQTYARSAALGMGAMTNVALHRITRKVVSYLPPTKQTNESTLGASIYGLGKPAQSVEALRWPNGGAAAEIKNLDSAHFPQMAFWPAYEHGDQFFQDLMYHEVTLPGSNEAPEYGFYGTSVAGGVTIPYGGISYKGQIRAASHQARPIGNALGLGNPNDPHWVMTRDYLNHWAEMINRVGFESDNGRGGTARTDGRRFQDLKTLVPNNEPTYKVWMHTLGMGAMAYSYGISEHPKLKEMAEFFVYVPTVMAGGYHNDSNYLMKPDPIECIGYQQICMDGIVSSQPYPNTTGSPASTQEYRRYWHFGLWGGVITDCTYLADGQTITMSGPAYGSTTMLNGMLVTPSALRGGEPHWASSPLSMPPLGLTPGVVYYTVQASGNNVKLSLTLGGAPVTFTPLNGQDQVGHIFRKPVAGVHPMKPGNQGDSASSGYLVQIKSAMDMVQYYCLPDDARLLLARQKLAGLKATSTNPDGYDERGKTLVPNTGPAGAFSDAFSSAFE